MRKQRSLQAFEKSSHEDGQERSNSRCPQRTWKKSWSKELMEGSQSIFRVRVHFLLRSISPSQIHLNYSVIVPCFSSPSQKENLLNAFSNQNVGKYSTFSNGNTFSAPSQMEYMFYISRNLLRFFSMEIPSQLLLK